ncbi:two-component system response regulator [Ligilactobacillus salitolerans]|uniref:Two-component system response regulator n=1 Tax=Ligilactobacillus salitolerans TaxID=1808352 RepID=A0A401IUX1_9LACO|nr:LytTR family transcriptional regulator DNA-binding domain-containing protein [Ligilactobacillus salitolerans]GBG95298.1 two-component system response regulator [Ligilactobacillus salitolerans]
MKILLVDDEPLARTELEYLLKQSRVLAQLDYQIFQAEDLKEAQTVLLKDRIDLIFLDISLNEENGFELADELKQLSYSPLIIFATAYDEYAVRAFNVDALDYVLKPFEQQRIDQALSKAVKTLHLEAEPEKQPPISEMLSIELADRNVLIKKDDLVAAEISEGVLTISTLNTDYTTKKTLAWLKEKMTDPKFMQVHRNALVNLERVKEIQPWFNHTSLLIMANGQKVQVGRSFQKALGQKLGI